MCIIVNIHIISVKRNRNKGIVGIRNNTTINMCNIANIHIISNGYKGIYGLPSMSCTI